MSAKTCMASTVESEGALTGIIALIKGADLVIDLSFQLDPGIVDVIDILVPAILLFLGHPGKDEPGAGVFAFDPLGYGLRMRLYCGSGIAQLFAGGACAFRHHGNV